jgi:hypothetical protein
MSLDVTVKLLSLGSVTSSSMDIGQIFVQPSFGHESLVFYMGIASREVR